MTTDIKARLRGVKALFLDVDGVQTDGGLYYTEDGRELRRFNVRDGLGIQRVMNAGIPVVFVTRSETPSITARAKKLGITRCLSGVTDKVPAVTQLCAELGVAISQIAYMGDDINDLELMRVVGVPTSPADAEKAIAELAVWRSSLPGGGGAVRELCELVLASKA